MTTLSICIPSHAGLPAARASIDSALALLPYGEVEVVVSDNSGDEQKAAYYGALQREGFRYLRSSHQDAMHNWSHAVDNASGVLVMMLGDDDIVTALPGFAVPSAQSLAGLAGFRPAFAMFSEGQGVYRPTNFAVQGARATDRVQDYLVKNGGSNVTVYSAVRRDIWRSLFAGYLAHHPSRAGYTDWSLTFALVATAPLTQQGNLLYLYNNANWDSAEKIRSNTDRGMKSVGLPNEASQIQMALQAVDTFVAICRADLALPADEKLEAGLLATSVYFNSLVGALQKRFESNETPTPKLLQTAKIALSAQQPAEQLSACIVILEMWLPQLREPYQNFFDNVLDPAIAKAVGLAGG
ncbi:MAG: glycosyltransferase family 2 protein [Sinobacteraceae bacterium]|nr:glycosyltransferase family 2 protein [Nevskiaceae bacterium]